MEFWFGMIWLDDFGDEEEKDFAPQAPPASQNRGDFYTHKGCSCAKQIEGLGLLSRIGYGFGGFQNRAVEQGLHTVQGLSTCWAGPNP